MIKGDNIMGYKGTMRSIGAAVRAAERDAKRRQREIERRAKEVEKMEELERASFEVSRYENKIEIMTTLHKGLSGCSLKNLESIREPMKPSYQNNYEQVAQFQLDEYKPNLIDKIFKRSDKKISELKMKLAGALEHDKNEFELLIANWEKDKGEFDYFNNLLSDIKSDDRIAYKTWFELSTPFEEIENIGTKVNIDYDEKIITVKIASNSINIIPEITKSLLKSGKLSEKKTSLSKRNELYQDYIASESIKAARELFAMLPIDEVIINSNTKMLNKSTGYHEDTTILSAFYVRETIEHINYNLIDPSEALTNFVHNMKFKKTTGFAKTDMIKRS